MQELQAQVALQQVALPLHEVETRARGLDALPGLLWAQDGTPVENFPRLSMNRAGFVDELCKHATPAEMVMQCLGSSSAIMLCHTAGKQRAHLVAPYKLPNGHSL